MSKVIWQCVISLYSCAFIHQQNPGVKILLSLHQFFVMSALSKLHSKKDVTLTRSKPSVEELQFAEHVPANLTKNSTTSGFEHFHQPLVLEPTCTKQISLNCKYSQSLITDQGHYSRRLNTLTEKMK